MVVIVTFLSLNKKVTKEVSIGKALMSPPGAKYTLPYVPIPWRAVGTAEQGTAFVCLRLRRAAGDK